METKPQAGLTKSPSSDSKWEVFIGVLVDDAWTTRPDGMPATHSMSPLEAELFATVLVQNAAEAKARNEQLESQSKYQSEEDARNMRASWVVLNGGGESALEDVLYDDTS